MLRELVVAAGAGAITTIAKGGAWGLAGGAIALLIVELSRYCWNFVWVAPVAMYAELQGEINKLERSRSDAVERADSAGAVRDAALAELDAIKRNGTIEREEALRQQLQTLTAFLMESEAEWQRAKNELAAERSRRQNVEDRAAELEAQLTAALAARSQVEQERSTSSLGVLVVDCLCAMIEPGRIERRAADPVTGGFRQ